MHAKQLGRVYIEKNNFVDTSSKSRHMFTCHQGPTEKHIDQHFVNTLNLLLTFAIVTYKLFLSSSACEIAS